jgi:O-antigen/teichoic acid export membrane protein
MDRTLLNMSSAMIAWGWPVLLSFLITPLLLRGLGLDAFGVRSILIMMVGYFSMLNFGISGAVTKYLSEYISKGDSNVVEELLSTSLWLHVLIGIIGGLAIFFTAKSFVVNVFEIPGEIHEASISALKLASVTFFFTMINSWAGAVVTGLHRFDIYNYIMMLFGTLTLLGSLVLVLQGYGLVGVSIANLVAACTVLVVYFVVLRRSKTRLTIEVFIKKRIFFKLVKFGGHMATFGVFAIFFSQIDRILVGIYLGTAMLAYYVIPHQLAVVIHQLTAKVLQFLFPLISVIDVNDKSAIRKICLKGVSVSFILSLSLALPIIVFGDSILLLWIGEDVQQASGSILKILTLSYVLMSLTAVFSSVFGGMGHVHIVSLSSIATGVVGALLYYLTIEEFGLLGVSISGVVAITASVLIYVIKLVKYLDMKIFELFMAAIYPILVFIIMVAFFNWINLFLIFNSLLGVLTIGAISCFTYVWMCWIFNLIKADEKRRIMSFVRNFLF